MSTPPGPQDPYGQQPPQYGQQSGYTPPPPTGSYGGAPQNPPPPNYLVWAILTTVLCCLPLGVVSIVFSTQVNSKWAAGDVQGALDSSRKAKLFAIWSAIATAIGVLLYVLLFVVIGVSGGFETTYN
jgi:hypothetical protein